MGISPSVAPPPLRGGAVIKSDYSQINVCDINCQTAPYRPAIFTSLNDDSVGESMAYSTDPNYTGSPTYEDVYCFLYTANPTVLRNMRFSYTYEGIQNLDNVDLWDCQFLNVDNPVWGNGAGSSGSVGMYNVLINEVADDCAIGISHPGTLTLENVTCDSPNGSQGLACNNSGDDAPLTVTVINSLITYPDGNGGTYVSTDNVNWTDNTGSIYQTIGAGNYYLANGSSWQNAGTACIDPNLLADLATKTTYPPVVYADQLITNALTFSPQALRDNSGTPDFGYHYDPIDFLVGGCDLYTNLTLAAGTTLAWYESNVGTNASGQPYGLLLNNGASFTTLGIATAPCWFTRYNTVQEGVMGSTGWMGGVIPNGNGSLPYPQISASFTKFMDLPDMGCFLRDNWAAGVGGFTDCELYQGFSDYWPSYYFTNCLFVRGGLGISSPETNASFTCENCTFWRGELDSSRSSGQSQSQWTILNTTFDGTVISTTDGLGGNTSNTCFDYNAFLSYSNRLEIWGAHDVTNNTSFNWQTSFLGNYYLPTNSPLIAQGSTTADQIGLDAFTTQTNQTPEGNSMVDIGYHYLALLPPNITQQPENTVTILGETTGFDVIAAGYGPFTYQWLFDGVQISNIITTVAGSYSMGGGYSGDSGAATNAGMHYTGGVAIDGAGNLYVADTFNHVVRKVNTNGIITTVAGKHSLGGTYSGDGGAATNAGLNYPQCITVDGFGNLYISDFNNNVVRKVNASGIITTVAGKHSIGGTYSGDGGAATNAGLYRPLGITLDGSGNLYFTEWGNNVVREVATNGIITTVAGNHSLGGSYSGDGGAATNAGLNVPTGVTFDGFGNLYIADCNNGVIRQVDVNGNITTIAGNYNLAGSYSGDNGAATNAALNGPNGLVADEAGNLFIADYYNNVIRQVDMEGNITTVAGDYDLGQGYSGDGGTATSATLNNPPGVALDSVGDLYIADSGNNVIRRVTNINIYGANGILNIEDAQTNGTGDYQVVVSSPYGSVTSSIVTLTVEFPPVISTQPTNVVYSAGDNASLSVAASGNLLNYQWWFDGSPLNGATSATLTLNNIQTNEAGYYYVVVSNDAGTTNSFTNTVTVQATYYDTFAGSLTNYIFQSDTTYYINSGLLLYGNTTIEGGAVIKLSTNATLNVIGSLVCKTGPYRPAVLTSKDDNSAGLIIHGSSGVPQTAGNGPPYLNLTMSDEYASLTNDTSVNYLRFAYANQGLTASSYSGNLQVWNCQFVNCNQAIEDGDYNCTAVYLHNDLFAACGSAVGGPGGCAYVNGEQLTADVGSFWDTNSPPSELALNNSIIIGGFSQVGDGLPAIDQTNNCAVNPSNTVFQSVGGGNYYLATNSPYYAAGNSNISPLMSVELAQKTTHPPLVYTAPNGYFSTSLNLYPQATRDTNSTPDLGYHYDPLDVLMGGIYVTNASITLNAGTAVGLYGTNGLCYGVAIANQAQFISIGSPNNLNHLAAYNTVQEQKVSSWLRPFEGLVLSFYGGNMNYQCRFTDWAVLAQDCVLFYFGTSPSLPQQYFQDCQFHGGFIESYNPTICLSNCLLERVYADLEPNDTNTTVFGNNQIWGGTFAYWPSFQTNSIIRDNLFDAAVVPDGLGASGLTYVGGHNAYNNGSGELDPVLPGDLILSNSLVYESGPLGNYYQPTNSPLLNAGSASAAQVGLYHFTVNTNEIIEGTNTVSIGYHYVAVDTNGNPLISNSQGIPDYLLDTNGNGLGAWDLNEGIAGSPPPPATNHLAFWRFDNTNTWVGDQGQLPIATGNLVGIPSWDTNAVWVDNPGSAVIAYNFFETSGNSNISMNVGTVRLWFKPDWSSSTITGGTGPGSAGRLIQLGTQSVSNGWWGLEFNANGTQIMFGNQTNGLAKTILAAPITWITNQWHQIVLTYTNNGSTLYLDGQSVTNGGGATNFPNSSELAKGIYVGCETNGTSQARGAFDDLETFNYVLSATNIAAAYLMDLQLDSNTNGLSNIQENQLGMNPYGDSTSNTGTRINYLFDPSGWLYNINGFHTGSIGFDDQGNIQTDSQSQ